MNYHRHEGADLYFETTGQGEPMLLIHGTGADSGTWGGVVEHLAAKGHRVIAYDRRGYGRSRHRPVRDYRQHVADAIALLERVVGEPANIVGWSSGANVALALASERPDLVRRLVVIEPPFHGVRHATTRMCVTIMQAKWRQITGRPTEAATVFFRWAAGDASWEAVRPSLRERFLANSPAVLAELDPHPFSALCEHVSARDVRRTGLPITYLIGERTDRVFRKVHRALTKAVPELRTEVIPGAGHFAHLDAAQRFVDAVHGALSTPPPEAASRNDT